MKSDLKDGNQCEESKRRRGKWVGDVSDCLPKGVCVGRYLLKHHPHLNTLNQDNRLRKYPGENVTKIHQNHLTVIVGPESTHPALSSSSSQGIRVTVDAFISSCRGP